MKIMFVMPTSGGGGAERVATLLANRFAERHSVEFYCLERNHVQGYGLDNRVILSGTDIDPPRGSKIKAIASYVKNLCFLRLSLREAFERFSPDVVISFLPKADMLVYLLKKTKKFIWISSERNDPWERNILERIVLSRIYARADVLVCQTKAVEKYYRAQGITRTCVIANPLSTQENPETRTKIHKGYAIAVGKLSRQKNYELMIRSFYSAIKDLKNPPRLRILGEGPLRSRLVRLIEKLRAADSIVLEGRKSDVYTYLRDADFFIMSSDYEGMPNALLEAMNAGLPVICTDFRSGAAHELINNENGYLVPVRNTKKMREAIAQMLQKTDGERRLMGEAGKEAVRKLQAEFVLPRWEALLPTFGGGGKLLS